MPRGVCGRSPHFRRLLPGDGGYSSTYRVLHLSVVARRAGAAPFHCICTTIATTGPAQIIVVIVVVVSRTIEYHTPLSHQPSTVPHISTSCFIATRNKSRRNWHILIRWNRPFGPEYGAIYGFIVASCGRHHDSAQQLPN